MKMAKISRVIGSSTKKLMVLVWVGSILLGNNTAAAGEQKSDKPAVIQDKTVMHHKVVSHKKSNHRGVHHHSAKHQHFNAIDGTQHAIATVYGGSRWNGNPVACASKLHEAGHHHLAIFNDEELTAASNVWRCGDVVSVTNKSTKQVVQVTITDTGNLGHGVIDLSSAAAMQLGMIDPKTHIGTAHVIIVGVRNLISKS